MVVLLTYNNLVTITSMQSDVDGDPRKQPLECRSPMPRHRQRRPGPPSFGARLAAVRQAKGMTQAELADAIGSNQRNVSYYESEDGHAPPAVLTKIVRVLGVSTDELLGVRPARTKNKLETPRNQQLWKRFQLLVNLPERDQTAVMRMINSLAAANGLVKRKTKEATAR